MEIIATYWWVWLICMFAFFGVAMFNQINRIRRMGDFDSGFDGFKKGLFVFAIAGLGSAVFGVLFLIGVIVQIINYAKG